MTEFMLGVGSTKAAALLKNCDEFTQGYIEAMFFTDASDPDDGDLADATVDDLSDEAWQQILADCAGFQATHQWKAACKDRESDKLEEPPEFGDDQAGRDFWFTRNGHGVGFWDRDDEVYGRHGELLCVAARRFGSCDVYRGDDGKIYLS